MLGYPIVFTDCMLRVNRYSHARAPVALRPLFFLAALLIVLAATTTEVCSAQQGRRLPAPQGGVANLEAKEARYNVSTGHGLFHNVRGTVKIERRPNPELLISDNPLYFDARDVERFPAGIYLVHKAWITICDPEHPKWQFYAPNARIHLDKTVALVNANFRLFRVPLIWLPYATAPAGRRVRASGVLIPDIGQSSRKGYILGDAFYLAPTQWMDATLGAQFMSRRGVLERGSFRAKPFENTSIEYTYFGVDDRGLPNSDGTRSPQGGEQQRLEIQSLLPGGWRFVTDYNHLSSL